MASTEIEICNASLSRLGAPAITSLSGTDKRSVTCNTHYSRTRDMLLRSHPWNFAIKRASLTEDGTAPAFEYENRFQLPADYLRALQLEYKDYEFKIEGGYLLTNEGTAKLIYIAKITDVTEFDPMFDQLLEVMLAYNMCYSLVQSVSLRNSLSNELKLLWRDVRSADAQEGTPESFEFNEWIEARL